MPPKTFSTSVTAGKAMPCSEKELLTLAAAYVTSFEVEKFPKPDYTKLAKLSKYTEGSVQKMLPKIRTKFLDWANEQLAPSSDGDDDKESAPPSKPSPRMTRKRKAEAVQYNAFESRAVDSRTIESDPNVRRFKKFPKPPPKAKNIAKEEEQDADNEDEDEDLERSPKKKIRTSLPGGLFDEDSHSDLIR